MTSPLLVGTLNSLGDAFNPFEFLSDDPGFREQYGQLQKAADALHWDGFVRGCGNLDLSSDHRTAGLREHCASGRSVWSYFDEPTLKNDNKLLEPRLNLLTFAMRPHGSQGLPTWQLLDRWQAEMQTMCDSTAGPGSVYSEDPHLLVWDCACNIVAASEAAAYRSICAASPLNSANFKTIACNFFDAALHKARGRPLVLGVQEWPKNDTPKAQAFFAALEERNLSVVCGPSEAGVALVYSKELGTPEPLPVRAAEVMQSCLDAAAEAGEGLDAKAANGFMNTTACKVLLVRFPAAPATAASGTAFLVLHAKEPKTPTASRVLTRFTQALCEGPVVMLMDTNTSTEDDF